MRLLVAEDNEDMNEIIVKKLRAEGFEVDSCINGEEAVYYMKYGDYDAGIFDIMMPVMDGMEALAQLRSQGNQTPVIFLTAKDTIRNKVDGLNLGANDYKESSINELAFSACEDYRLLAENGITIKTQAQQEISAFINSDLFMLMLNNLIQNAIRYGKENGTVCVKLEDGDHTFTISVSDDGEGISEKDLPHIWDLFYRGDKSRNSQGLGLGLSLVKQIVKYHNGTIAVESIQGQGTTFIVTLPKTAS